MRIKLLMVSAGASLVMALSACGGSDSDTDAPEEQPGITWDYPTENTGDWEPTYVPEPEPPYVPAPPSSNEKLLDDMHDINENNLDNYQGW